SSDLRQKTSFRYLLLGNNYKVENVVSTTASYVTNANLFAKYPWIPAWLTNIVDLTNYPALTNFPSLTNLFGATNFVATGLRPGIGKLTFERVKFDSLISQTFTPITNSYTETVLTNSVEVTQDVDRIINAPDIVFLAGDLGINADGIPIFMSRSGTTNWVNNAALNSMTAVGGPGVIQPQIQISLSTTMPYFVNQTPSFLNEATAFGGFAWGSFDGSTNAPVVYPANGSITLQYLEQQILGGR
ncbi:MAG: hypothetical protein M1608_10155, partial [Candidatus Omnitrophica bacterium]|nr:hypothetical protein [Candidatus Omnitrophota bacterium]